VDTTSTAKTAGALLEEAHHDSRHRRPGGSRSGSADLYHRRSNTVCTLWLSSQRWRPRKLATMRTRMNIR